jgi:hypothetical protein
MAIGTGAAILGSAVIGGLASRSASKTASKGQDRAIAAQQRLLGPYAEAGHAGLAGVQDFVNQGANFSDTQAFKDITNSAKAGGQYLSGNRATALTDYYATNFRPQRLQELGFLPKLGANAAAGQATNEGNLYAQQGATRAAGYLGMGSAASQGLNSLAFLNLYNQGNTMGGQVDSLLMADINTLIANPQVFDSQKALVGLEQVQALRSRRSAEESRNRLMQFNLGVAEQQQQVQQQDALRRDFYNRMVQMKAHITGNDLEGAKALNEGFSDPAMVERGRELLNTQDPAVAGEGQGIIEYPRPCGCRGNHVIHRCHDPGWVSGDRQRRQPIPVR